MIKLTELTGKSWEEIEEEFELFEEEYNELTNECQYGPYTTYKMGDDGYVLCKDGEVLKVYEGPVEMTFIEPHGLFIFINDLDDIMFIYSSEVDIKQNI